jgi:hypothetical protein
LLVGAIIASTARIAVTIVYVLVFISSIQEHKCLGAGGAVLNMLPGVRLEPPQFSSSGGCAGRGSGNQQLRS